MTTYVITIKTLNVKLSFSIVHDKNLDDLSSKFCKGDLAFSEISDKVLPALARQERYILAGLVSDELNSSQSYCEGDAETANDVITLTVEETSARLAPCYVV
jgi:hypothetical protein